MFFILLIQLFVLSSSCILEFHIDSTVKWMNAFSHGSSATLNLLKIADPFERNDCGENAFDVARKTNDLSAVQLLNDYYLLRDD